MRDVLLEFFEWKVVFALGRRDAPFSSLKKMARVTGLEPATSGVTGRHSNQLSYTRIPLREEEKGGLRATHDPVKCNVQKRQK